MGIKKLIKKAAKKAIEKNGRAKIKLEKVKFSELRLAIENYNRKNDRSIDDIIFADDEFVLVLEDQREDDSEDEAITPEPVAKNIAENKVADNVEVCNVNEDLKRSENSKRNRRRKRR